MKVRLPLMLLATFALTQPGRAGDLCTKAAILDAATKRLSEDVRRNEDRERGTYSVVSPTARIDFTLQDNVLMISGRGDALLSPAQELAGAVAKYAKHVRSIRYVLEDGTKDMATFHSLRRRSRARAAIATSVGKVAAVLGFTEVDFDRESIINLNKWRADVPPYRVVIDFAIPDPEDPGRRRTGKI